MAAVTIHNDFGVQENKVCYCFHFFPIYLPWSDRPDAMFLVFWMLSFKPSLSLSSFTFIKKLFSSSSLSALRVVSSAYLRLLIFLPDYLLSIIIDIIPTCDSSSPAFCMMSSAYKLNKQVNNVQPWCTPFPILSQSIVPCPVLTNCCFLICTQVSRETDRMVCYFHLFKNFPQFVVIHKVKVATII